MSVGDRVEVTHSNVSPNHRGKIGSVVEVRKHTEFHNFVTVKLDGDDQGRHYYTPGDLKIVE